MILDKDDKIKIVRAIQLLDILVRKQETSENIESWRQKTPSLLATPKEYNDYIESLQKEGDLDEEIMRVFAQQVCQVLPKELLEELKEKYFL